MIVWGTTIKRRRLGRVADFCGICRDIRAFTLMRIGKASHVYLISFGGGSLIGHEIKCETCGNVQFTEGEQYATTIDDQACRLPDLITQTHPDLLAKYEDRLRMEQSVRNKTLTSKERQELLREAFLLVNGRIEDRAGAAHFDIYSALMPFVTAGLMALVIVFVRPILGPDPALNVFFGVGALGFVCTIILLATDVRRFVKRRIYPVLVSTLLPLEPSREDLEISLKILRKLGLIVGKKVKAGRLIRVLQDASVTSPSNGHSIRA